MAKIKTKDLAKYFPAPCTFCATTAIAELAMEEAPNYGATKIRLCNQHRNIMIRELSAFDLVDVYGGWQPAGPKRGRKKK